MRQLVFASLLTLSTHPLLAAGKTHKSHDHGHAKLDVAVDGMQAKIELESPAESIFGFEHTARTDAEKKAVAEAMATLKDKAKELFVFPADAGCEVTKTKIDSDVFDAPKSKKHKGHDHDHDHDEHSDVEADYSFTCKKPLAGSELKVTLNKAFPRLKSLKVQVVSGSKQFGAELNATNDTLKL